jgi:hypothetical protein
MGAKNLPKNFTPKSFLYKSKIDRIYKYKTNLKRIRERKKWD